MWMQRLTKKVDFWTKSKLTWDKMWDLDKKWLIRSAQCNCCHLPARPPCIDLNYTAVEESDRVTNVDSSPWGPHGLSWFVKTGRLQKSQLEEIHAKSTSPLAPPPPLKLFLSGLSHSDSKGSCALKKTVKKGDNVNIDVRPPTFIFVCIFSSEIQFL